MLRNWCLANHPVLTTVAQIVAYYQASWYDPSDLTTLFQDAAMTVPVATDLDPVGAMKDKGPLGIHLTQSVAGSREIFRTAAGKMWLSRDAVDDQLASAVNAYPNINYTHYMAMAGSYDVAAASMFAALKSSVLYHRLGSISSGRHQSGYRAASGAYTAQSAVSSWLAATNAVVDSQVDAGFLDEGVNGTVVIGGAPIATDSIGTSTVYDCNSLAVVANFYGGIAIRARITAAERAVINAFLATKI